MKVIIKNSSSGSETILCHGDRRQAGYSCGPHNLSVNDAVVSDPAEFLRATAAKVFLRNNRRTVITFQVTRLFSTIREAQSWILQHLSACVRDDTLYLDAESSTGSALRLTLSDSVLDQISQTMRGTTLFITYRITGGAIS